MGGKCSVDDCEKPRRTRGFCDMHYARWLRTGDHRLASWSVSGPSVETLPDGSVEKWSPIPGYEGRYEVSDQGHVRSLPRRKVRLLHTFKAAPDVAGYPAVTLSPAHGGRDRWRVHELVLLAFVGSRPTGMPHIRHLDGVKTNNKLSNLAYGTVSENQLDRVVHGTHHEASKTHCVNGHPFDAANTYRIRSRPRSRYCRLCQAENRNRRRSRQRAQGLPVT